MIKQLEVLMYEERLKELHVCRLAEELRSMCMCVGWGPDSCLQIIESISPEEGEGLWRWVIRAAGRVGLPPEDDLKTEDLQRL